MTEEERKKIEEEYLDALFPEWKTNSYTEYSQEMFNKQVAAHGIKSTLIAIRGHYSKHSKKSASCFCHKGMFKILEWLIHRNKQ